MKLINEILIIFTLIFLTSCNNQDNSKRKSKLKDSKKSDLTTSLNNIDTLKLANDLNNRTIANISIWDFDCDSILKIRNVNKDTLTYKKLIRIINAVYIGKVFLDFVKISHDTIFVKIIDSEYLTQQMGTCGAEQFMISTTFTLTELNDLKYVDFDFEFGDHTSPGTYSRKYYLDWIENNRKSNQK